MKEKGFTLIELLAVIVILAIIALIATPIILNIISDAKEEVNKRSIDMYAKAIQNAAVSSQLNSSGVMPGNYSTSTLPLTVTYDGAEVSCDTIQIKKDGTIYLEGCMVGSTLVEEYTYGTESICMYSDEDNSGTINLSDIVTCGTESFYVIVNDETNVEMLSMYNLNVGDNKYPNELTYGIQDENVYGEKTGHTTYGEVAFSTSNYWEDDNNDLLSQFGTKFPAYVYGNYSENVVYQYVNSYETYLKEELKVSSASASLINRTRVKELWKSNVDWLYSTSYWVGSVCNNIYTINASELADGCFSNPANIGFTIDNGKGVRPVVTISTSEID